MIKGVMIINNHGKPRITKFYEHLVRLPALVGQLRRVDRNVGACTRRCIYSCMRFPRRHPQTGDFGCNFGLFCRVVISSKR